MQQHAEAIDRRQSMRARRFEKCRFKRHIDNVGRDTLGFELGKIDVRVSVALHAKRRRIDDHA